MQEESVNNTNIPKDEPKRETGQKSVRNENATENNASKKIKNPNRKSQLQHRESIRRKMVFKFAKWVGTIVGGFLLAGSIAILAINASQNTNRNAFTDTTPLPSADTNPQPDNGDGITGGPTPGASDSILLPPLKTNFLVVGKDESGLLTDVIIVGCFDRDTHDISLISIPRDTLIVIPPARLQKMNDLGLYPPADGTMKINAINSYGRDTYGIPLLEEQLKDLLGVDFQYEIEIDLQAFRNIIDDLGGVYFNVPAPGMYYNDPYQNLHIAIPPGWQYLDGNAAEGLVRYRATYRDGDIQRIGVQQEFLQALFSQVLERQNIVQNAFSVAKAIIGYTKTDFSLTDIPKYLRYVNDISADNIHFYTLPCVPQYIGDVSYVIPNDDQIKQLVNDVFYKITESEPEPSETEAAPSASEPEATPTPVPDISSQGLSIEILNGSGKAGLAGVFQNMLSADGFTVAKIDTYTGVQMDKTQILVRSEGMGSDLVRYFKNSLIQVTPNLPSDYDIIIITGKGES